MKHYAILAFMLLSACGSLKVRDVNKAEIGKVRTAAIVSFSLIHPISTTLISVGGSGPNSAPAKDSEVTRSYYLALAQSLQQSQSWRVMSPDKLTENSSYQTVFVDKMKGFQRNKVPPHGQLLTMPQIMDAQSLMRMTLEQRTALAKALGVDLLIEAQVDVRLETKGMAVMGIGTRYPQARITMRAYKPGVDAPVWFEGGLDGDMAEENVGKTGHFNEEDMLKIALKSARSAYAKLGNSTKASAQ